MNSRITVAGIHELIHTVHMENQIKRWLQLQIILEKKSILLLGPRRTGKSFLIKNQIKPDLNYNLLQADVFRKLSANPELIRQSLNSKIKTIAIDEIQKLPSLMDEVHSIIEDSSVKFILTGSSARKLKKNHTSLMAGRAKLISILPFTKNELGKKFDLNQALMFGLIPGIYFLENKNEELLDYVGLYLKEEIMEEARVRKIENFSRFLNFAALSSGQILNFEKLSQDSQVPARTIREYYQLLVETLFGYEINPIKSTASRKCVSKSKFYFFDTGVVNALKNNFNIQPKTIDYGYAFEHFIFMELKAFQKYKMNQMTIEFWNDYNNGEIDFILNNEIAIEVKATENVNQQHLKSMKNFIQAGSLKKHYVVSLDKMNRKDKSINIIYYEDFLDLLWAGKII